MRLAKLRQAHQQVDPLHVALGHGELSAQVIRQLLPLLGLYVQPIQRTQRADVLSVVAEDLVVGRDRIFRLLQHLLVDSGDAEQDAEALVRIIRDVDLLAVDLEQLRVLLLRREDPIQGFDSALVVRLHSECHAVVLDRLDGVVQPLYVRGPQP